MPIRITGMNSGLDTENIISELIKAKSAKKNTLTKAQKKLEYKQDAWKTLNSKVYTLYSKTISNLTFTSSYKQQKTNVSNSSVASVITGKDASNGVQELYVDKLAKSGYLTGAQLDPTGANTYTASKKLSEIVGSGISEGDNVSFSITTNGTTTDIKLSGSSTISDVVSQLKNAGVNANFDEKNQRLFISAKTTGAKADFALTASTDGGFKALSALGINVMDTQTKAQYEKYANLSADEKAAMITAEVVKQAADVNAQINSLNEKIQEHNTKINDFLTKYSYADASDASIDTDYEDLKTQKETLATVPEDETEEQKTEREAKLKEVEGKIAEYDAYKKQVADKTQAETELSTANEKVANDNAKIVESVTADIEAKIASAQNVVNSNFGGASSGATRVEGRDAVIKLNDAEFTSETNSFEINGLTITALQESKPGEIVTLTTADDYDAIYDTIKTFIKEYNTLINEMDKLYNAESAKGYEPLLDEEKEAMSESEIEKWETKIKDSILRRDTTLGEVSNLLKSSMMKGYEVNGKTMYLANFGINTLGYFNANANERNAYHIDGDPDDEATMGNKDVLKTMIASDPETVISFFTQLSRDLYSNIGEKMKSNDYSSFNKIYNDKQMDKDYKSYTSKIAKQQEIITAAEDKYYKQFSAMETALAKMQSKESAIAGLLGG